MHRMLPKRKVSHRPNEFRMPTVSYFYIFSLCVSGVLSFCLNTYALLSNKLIDVDLHSYQTIHHSQNLKQYHLSVC